MESIRGAVRSKLLSAHEMNSVIDLNVEELLVEERE
jgi:hypothetical protein